MALLTPVDEHDARRLGALYGLDVIAVRPILAGSVNTNLALMLRGGERAFMRVYEEQREASAQREASLLEHLSSHGVRTPRPMALRDDPSRFIAEHAGKPVAVFPWVAGEMRCQASITPSVARKVGEALARVHVAGASFERAPQSRFGARDLERRMQNLRATALPDELSAIVARLGERLDSALDRSPAPEFSGLVHGDLFRDNVLFVDDEISALLDFESASHESYAFDLMVTILAWCFGDGLDRALASAMAQGYASVRPMSEAEALCLYDEGSFAALRFSITRITNFELRPRGQGVFKDYRRFVARADALEALGREGLRTFLGV